jgi:hypothetical protein
MAFLSSSINSSSLAQHMMAETSDALVDIALSVGFQTQGHFTTVFKKIVGNTPCQWRRSNLMWPDVLVQRAQLSGIRRAEPVSSMIAWRWMEKRGKGRGWTSFSQSGRESPWLALNRSIARRI